MNKVINDIIDQHRKIAAEEKQKRQFVARMRNAKILKKMKREEKEENNRIFEYYLGELDKRSSYEDNWVS